MRNESRFHSPDRTISMNPQDVSTWMQKQVLPCTVLLAIGRGNPLYVVDQGTGMLLATGKTEMLVTCGHVYDKFLELRENDPTTRLAMSGAAGKEFLDISTATVLGKETEPDLATLAIPRIDANGAGKAHALFTPWPPRRAEKGMMGYLIGYPGELIVVTKETASKPVMEFARPVVSVSERHFVLHDESGDVVQTYAEGMPTVTRLGGISGCAVWIYSREPGEGLAKFWLGGFAYQARGTDTVLVAHADFINADGSIR
jgi:hypothetical protein